MNDLISVIVPVYNVKAYLRDCVESIENQTYENFEIILVDDGSADTSGIICDELSKKYGNIIVIHQKNAGASTARNNGIEVAKGKYVIFCDSDDYISPNMFMRLIEAKEKYPELLPVCGIKKISIFKEKDFILDGKSLIKINRSNFFKIQKAQLFNAPVNKLFTLDIIKQHNIRFNPSVTLGEDMIFNADYVMNANCDFIVVNEPLYFYDEEISDSLSKKYLPDILDNYIEMDKKFIQLIEHTKTDMSVYSERFATIRLFNIVNAIKNTMLPQNTATASEKIRQIKKILNAFDVSDIVSNADCSAYSDIYLKMLCTGNARLVYTFRTIKK